jgi:hypothetical protein
MLMEPLESPVRPLSESERTKVLACWGVFLVGTAVCSVVLVLAMWLVRDGAELLIFPFGLLLMGTGACVGVLLPIGAATWLGKGYPMRRHASTLMQFGAGGILLAATVFGSMLVGASLSGAEEDTVVKWAEGIVPAIERHQRENGRYPATLEEVADLPSAPRLVRIGKLHYRVVDDRFEFDLWTGGLSGRCWNSDEREWERYD